MEVTSVSLFILSTVVYGAKISLVPETMSEIDSPMESDRMPTTVKLRLFRYRVCPMGSTP